MERLDQDYLTNIIARAQKGSSNAFAEAFAAALQRHYMYLFFMLGSEEAARDMLKDVYVRIYQRLPSLGKPVLYMPWSCRIAFRCCQEALDEPDRAVQTPAGTFALSSLLDLPVSESQTAIMHYAQGMQIRDVGDILNFDVSTVKRCLRSALEHLTRGMPGIRSRKPVQTNPEHRSVQELRPGDTESMKLLEYLFETCGAEPNTIPLEALSAYAVYRKERFVLQRGILLGAMVLFLLLPLLFILPGYDVSETDVGMRGLPVYTVNIRSLIPAGKVKARLNTHALPVYEVSRKEYTIEPTRNGELTVEVELINRQSLKTSYRVTAVDAQGPLLTDSYTDGTTVKITVSDSGIGVDYREIFACSQSGQLYYPLSFDEETGEILFEYPQEPWDVYIPDHIGNMLHLAFTFE